MNAYIISWTDADRTLSQSILLGKSKLSVTKDFTKKCKVAYKNDVSDMFNIQITNIIDLGEATEEDVNELLAEEEEELMDYFQFWK